jgi:hypothetical protein
MTIPSLIVPLTAGNDFVAPFAPAAFVVLVGLPRIEPAVALVTAVPGIDREFPEESVHAFVESSKSAASNHIYGVSVTSAGFDATYEVPVPSAWVFHPTKVNPVFERGTLGDTEEPSLKASTVTAAEETAVVDSGTAPAVFELPL